MSKVIAGIFFSLVTSATGHATELQTRTSMHTHHATLWQLIDILGNKPFFTLNIIEKALPIEFTERHRTMSFSSYGGGPLRLADQIIIETVELRIRHKDGMSRLLGLDIAPCKEVCVTLDEVHKHYPEVVITDHPRGHSLDEQTYWSIQQSWGELSFGFKERNPDCLASVVLDRTPPPAPPPPTSSSP